MAQDSIQAAVLPGTRTLVGPGLDAPGRKRVKTVTPCEFMRIYANSCNSMRDAYAEHRHFLPLETAKASSPALRQRSRAAVPSGPDKASAAARRRPSSTGAGSLAEPGLHNEATQLNFVAGIGLSSIHAEPSFRPVRPAEAHARHRQLRFRTHYEIGPR